MSVIARLWHGWTLPDNADRYETLLKNEISVGIRKRPEVGRGLRGFAQY